MAASCLRACASEASSSAIRARIKSLTSSSSVTRVSKDTEPEDDDELCSSEIDSSAVDNDVVVVDVVCDFFNGVLNKSAAIRACLIDLGPFDGIVETVILQIRLCLY